MLTPRIRAALVVLAASAGLSACTNMGPYGGVGVGVSSGYGGYGNYGYDPYYSGYGYGSQYGYGYGSPYGYANYGGYGSGYGYDPFGWYNGYYYPGTGYWVYDRDRHRRRMTDAERAIWRERIRKYIERHGDGQQAVTKDPSGQLARENWSGFDRRPAATSAGTTATPTTTGREALRQRIIEQRAQRTETSAARDQMRAERQQARQSAAQDRSETRVSRRRPRD